MLGLTVIMVTHQMESRPADLRHRLGHRGRKTLSKEGLVAELFANPRSDARKGLSQGGSND